LSIYKLKRSDLIPLVDAVADMLPVWKSKFMSKEGRTMLMKVTLTVIPMHVSITVEVSPWIYEEIDKIRRAFVSTGSSSTSGDQCKVAWARVTWPKELGGLGILDLTMLRYVLRLRWLWLARTDPGRSWSALLAKEERLVWAMFDASTTIYLGADRSALFI
jgi:hypothetical protein